MHGRLLAAIGLAAALAAPAGAARLHGADCPGNGDDDTIDTATGLAMLLGDPANDSIADLTTDTRPGGALRGVDLDANALLTIDPATGGITSTAGITGARAPITSLAFDTVTGTLTGNDTGGFGGGAGALHTIDTGTGAASFVGAPGFGNNFALGFDQNGRSFRIDDGTDAFPGIDTTTGAATAIGATGLSSSFDIASDPTGNTMYLVDSGTRPLCPGNTATAAATLVGGWGAAPSNISGLAFVEPAPIPVPGRCR
jgi:hypothetical protein